MQRLVIAALFTVAACAGEEAYDGPYSGPATELLWPIPCRLDMDVGRDGTIDWTTYYILDELGQIVDGYSFRDGAFIGESHAAYDGRRLQSFESVSTADGD